MCTPFRVSISLPFSNAGCQKKAIFQKPVIKSAIALLSYEFSYAFEYAFR